MRIFKALFGSFKLGGLFGSKKFKTFTVTIVVAIGSAIGLDLPMETVGTLIQGIFAVGASAIALYGVQDASKEKTEQARLMAAVAEKRLAADPLADSGPE